MKARILSLVVDRGMTFAAATIATTLVVSQPASAQTGNGFYTDPSTGIVYRKVAKTIETPVVETKVESHQETVYTPKTITETKPESRTIYRPIVESTWQPRLNGRWNPFQQPSVSYHHVPQTRWEAHNEVVHRTQTRTEWVPETRKVDVPKQFVRMQREEKVDFEAVGRVAPAQQSAPGISNAIASRLRPLDANEQVQPIGQSAPMVARYTAPRIAASTVGRMTSDPPRRTIGQSGMGTTDLTPQGPGYHGQALPPNAGGIGVATLPTLPFFR
ncbi:hypothetical protein K227x_19660 [Rubripirellula lacrimiformis]|uniref:Secreted protein n=1 Tax=Rubripirellula lacrimiformis TaxID=1930273 RepID=A0A517N8Y2_9BACT|nr:hypothetical protein [Rubripirellula lacrimiformis]QDT03582.1 hypothetical protein K227x_19660 [Rubripirellula lacrimiformis]